MIKPQTLKGFRDFLPGEATQRNWLKGKLTEIFELWGYDPMETPTLEPLELFMGQIGEDEKLFFSFTDQGGRKVALRYDQTLPSVRVISQYQNQLTFPFKRYQIQNAYRAEKPQRGRFREFTQCDADIFGDPTPYADAETIALSLDIYQRLGFKNAKVLLNDRDQLKDLPYEALVSIDKIKKIGEEGVLSEMTKKGIDSEKAKEYLDKVKNTKPNETIKIILKYLKDYGFPESWYEFDPTITRSFAYSQGPIWEVVIPEYTAGSVLGGERYDKLFKSIFNAQMSGTGFALGFDRTLEAADQLGLIPKSKTSSFVLVTIFNKELYAKSLSVSLLLRNALINADIYPNPEAKLDKQIKYADKKGIPFVVIIGPEEIAKNSVTLKNLSTRTQEIIKIEDLPARLVSQTA
ncbi:histidine--tRNA ligase [Candidatus Gottesmanbacteria bacterium RIFCSPHIGHO2_01_FULL_39_10]|uniref:Histidine--tRNA ligase n=1 Tax=Candidatus Gottesmanbacteria bacterium RIFCSPHIGHO2_01_FULL_39_10 TaxID=1798375 RepID=A0A1F5ZQP2_9BACT|nr:MAG: histidine--tRNA ligase [Candidatus Gottesmanbacteria bacterium RIFCSPHIGHO2_01_FULL_39_10]